MTTTSFVAKDSAPAEYHGTAPALSVVIPVYCEEHCIVRCIYESIRILDSVLSDYEVIFVDDGSTDRTVEVILEYAATNPRLSLIELSRNHGKPAALTAGIRYARGQRILLMDPDLQESPAEIPRFMAKMDEGFDLVFGIRKARQDGLLTTVASKSFWWLLDRMTGLSVPKNLSAMRMFNYAFRERFLEYDESSRFIEGIMLHAGMRQATITVAHAQRTEGESRFTFRRKVSLALTAILDFSSIPLWLAIRFGILLTGLGFTLAIGLIIARLCFQEFQLGWPSLVVTMITGFGLQILFTGIVGVYIGQTFIESKKRPTFSVRKVTGFTSATSTPSTDHSQPLSSMNDSVSHTFDYDESVPTAGEG
jgi:dolichol-phosphate mannosyltransferase